MQQNTVTLVVAVVGIAGTLGGVFLGQHMTQQWQRKQWTLDRRKEEWRELLSALAESLRVQMKVYPGRVLAPDEQRAIVEAQSNSFRVIRDRIFIASDVAQLDIEIRWSKALMDHNRDLDPKVLGAAYDAIRKEIVKAATIGIG
jgi:hypothetical protein